MKPPRRNYQTGFETQLERRRGNKLSDSATWLAFVLVFFGLPFALLHYFTPLALWADIAISIPIGLIFCLIAWKWADL